MIYIKYIRYQEFLKKNLRNGNDQIWEKNTTVLDQKKEF